MQVVLVHLGSRLPAYAAASARQVESLTGRRPLVVGAWQARRLRGDRLRRFRRAEQLTEMGLRRFWRYACERFFVLEDAMREHGLERCLHIESDNVLYADPEAYATWLA